MRYSPRAVSSFKGSLLDLLPKGALAASGPASTMGGFGCILRPMHRKLILLIGIFSALALVAVALQGFQVVPERGKQAKYLVVLLAACLSLLLVQGWILLFFSALGHQLQRLQEERGEAVVHRLLALGRRCRPWAVATLLLGVAFFLLNPVFGHRWAPEWLAPALLFLTFGAHAAAVVVANQALREQESLLVHLDQALGSSMSAD